jgi:hypothetical protein
VGCRKGLENLGCMFSSWIFALKSVTLAFIMRSETNTRILQNQSIFIQCLTCSPGIKPVFYQDWNPSCLELPWTFLRLNAIYRANVCWLTWEQMNSLAHKMTNRKS